MPPGGTGERRGKVDAPTPTPAVVGLPTTTTVPARRLAQKKSMPKQKDAMGRCTVRPQRPKDGEPAPGKSLPRGRVNKDSLSELYAVLYERVPFDSPSDVALARVFSDKELRVLMGMNKMLINDLDPKTGKYTEKTKQNKIKVLLPSIGALARPEDLPEVVKPKRGSRTPVASGDGGAAGTPGMGVPRSSGRPALGYISDSEPGSPLVDPIPVPHSSDYSMQAPPFLENSFSYFTSAATYGGASPGRIVTPLLLPVECYLDDVTNASGYVCAAMGVHFTASCRERREPRTESAQVIQDEVLWTGVEAYRQSSNGRRGVVTRIDEVVSSDVLGQSLRIVDVRAFSRSLRYPSTLQTMISQLQRTPGSMATFLYGHGNFRDIQRTGATLFLGFFGASSEDDTSFVALDPRQCDPDTGFPCSSGSPVMLVFTSAAELHCHLEKLLQGEGTDMHGVDWQASFLEVIPPMGSDTDDADSTSHLTSNPNVSPAKVWLGNSAAGTPDNVDASVSIPVPEVLHTTMDSCIDGSVADPPPSSTPMLSDMEQLEQFMQRNSLDDDDKESLRANKMRGMNRSSLDDLEDVLPSLDPAESPCSLEHSVQEAIQLENAKQEDMAAWQAEMSARMHKSREEHERRQRMRQHSHHWKPPASVSPSSTVSSTLPDEAQPRKRRMSLSTSLGAAFRKRGPRASSKKDPATAPAPTASAPAAAPCIDERQQLEPPPNGSDIHQEAAADTQIPVSPKSSQALSAWTPTARYIARREDREVALEVSPTGVNVIDGEPRFHHLTTILSWRVRRSESSEPVGFKLVFTDGAETIFDTEQGREISDVLMEHAKGLASLMHGGMHVRGTAMVN